MKGCVAECRFRAFSPAVVQVHIIFPSEAHAAVNLDAAIADGARRVARVHFSDRNGDGCVRRIFFEGPSGIVHRGTGAFGFQIHVRALVLHGLKRADGFAELFARFGVFDGDVQSALHAADHFGGKRGGGDVESARQIDSSADFFGGSVVEFDDIEFARKVHGGHGRYFQAGRFGIHNEDAIARYYDNEIGHGGIGDEIFLAAEFAVGGCELNVAGIPAGVGFENGDGGASFAATDGPEIFLFVRGRGYRVENRAGEHDSGEKRAGQERAAGFFHQQHELDFAQANPAVCFGKNDAGVALVGELGPKIGVVGRVRFHQAAHFCAGTFAGEEFARTVFQKFLTFTQAELHGGSPSEFFGLITSGQAENKVADDVSLHFGSTGFDGIAARAQIRVRPHAIVNGTRVASQQLAVWAENFLRDLLQALIELAPEYFLDAAFGAGDAGGGEAAEGAHLIEAHDFDFGAALCELLANDGILRGGASVALDVARKFDQASNVTLENQVQARAVGAALVHQRAHGDVPAVVHFAEDVFSGHPHVAEEKLVEFGFARHLAQGANFDAGRFHIDEEDGEAFVFRGGGVGAHDEFAPIADPAVAGPNFLPADEVVVAVEDCLGLQTGEIGAGVWLGKSLAPDFFGAENFRDVALLLRFGAIGDDGRADEAEPEGIGHGRSLNARHFFPE